MTVLLPDSNAAQVPSLSLHSKSRPTSSPCMAPTRHLFMHAKQLIEDRLGDLQRDGLLANRWWNGSALVLVRRTHGRPDGVNFSKFAWQ